jgi:hypothetical protein
MFGLENGKSKKPESCEYELEENIQDPKKYRELIDSLDKQIFALKGELRKGLDEQPYEETGVLLQGFLAFKKVVERAQKNIEKGR